MNKPLDINNNTDLPLETIQNMTVVGRIRNNGRRLNIVLFADQPTLQAIADEAPLGYLYSIGYSFDRAMIVVAKEELRMNEYTALYCWANGKKTLVTY